MQINHLQKTCKYFKYQKLSRPLSSLLGGKEINSLDQIISIVESKDSKGTKTLLEPNRWPSLIVKSDVFFTTDPSNRRINQIYPESGSKISLVTQNCNDDIEPELYEQATKSFNETLESLFDKGGKIEKFFMPINSNLRTPNRIENPINPEPIPYWREIKFGKAESLAAIVDKAFTPIFKAEIMKKDDNPRSPGLKDDFLDTIGITDTLIRQSDSQLCNESEIDLPDSENENLTKSSINSNFNKNNHSSQQDKEVMNLKISSLPDVSVKINGSIGDDSSEVEFWKSNSKSTAVFNLDEASFDGQVFKDRSEYIEKGLKSKNYDLSKFVITKSYQVKLMTDDQLAIILQGKTSKSRISMENEILKAQGLEKMKGKLEKNGPWTDDEDQNLENLFVELSKDQAAINEFFDEKNTDTSLIWNTISKIIGRNRTSIMKRWMVLLRQKATLIN